MRLNVSGILSDYQGRILLRQETESSLIPIDSLCKPGVMPLDTLARAFREETGLVVMPVRMTGLYFSGRGRGELTFCYRCTMRGGDLAVPDGRPMAGFFDSTPLPRGLSPKHRQQIDQAMHHSGGPPVMEREAAGPGAWLGRVAGRAKSSVDFTEWDVTVQLAEMTEDDGVEWALAGSGEALSSHILPAGPGEAPWETAEHLIKEMRPGRRKPIARLVRIEVAADRPAMNFLFAPAG